MSSPGMAAQDAPDGKVEPFEWAVFSECLEGILRACGSEPAAWLLQWRDAGLIESDQKYERSYRDLLKRLFH